MMKQSKLWLTVQKLFQCHARDPFALGISCSKLGPKRTSVGATKKSILTQNAQMARKSLCFQCFKGRDSQSYVLATAIHALEGASCSNLPDAMRALLAQCGLA